MEARHLVVVIREPKIRDQAVVAGIGNIYADEILFQARIDPRTRSDGLAPAQLRLLHRMIPKVLKAAVACGAGSEDFTEHLAQIIDP